MKKYLLKILVLVFTLCVVLGCVVGCKHTHEVASWWSSNDTVHWKGYSCGCDESYIIKREHEIGFDGACTVCGREGYTKELVYQYLEGDSARLVGVLPQTVPNIIIIAREYNGAPVKEIGEYAFNKRADYYVGKVLYIPTTIVKIYSSALMYTSITDIIYEGTLEQWNAIEKEDYWFSQNVISRLTVTCVDGKIELIEQTAE